jgi:hypothetical protein
MSTTVTRLYDSYDDAQNAVEDLERMGVPTGNISIVANNADQAHGDHNKAAQDAGAGAGIGAAVGGVGGMLAGLGFLAIPGLGPVVAAGWLASTALGAGVGLVAGGTAGGLIGALQKEGVSERDAHVYSEGVRRGGSLVSAKVDDAAVPEAENILASHNPVNPEVRGRAYGESGWTRFDEEASPYEAAQIKRERDLYARSDTRI